MRPQGKARRKSSSNFDPKLNILVRVGAEVSNTSAFRRGEDGGGAGGGTTSLDPPVTSSCGRCHSVCVCV